MVKSIVNIYIYRKHINCCFKTGEITETFKYFHQIFHPNNKILFTVVSAPTSKTNAFLRVLHFLEKNMYL
jgi:hypothetical protein